MYQSNKLKKIFSIRFYHLSEFSFSFIKTNRKYVEVSILCQLIPSTTYRQCSIQLKKCKRLITIKIFKMVFKAFCRNERRNIVYY